MPKPTGVRGQPSTSPAPLPAMMPTETSPAQQTAAKLPVPKKIEASQATLENRSIQSSVKPGKWAQTKDFVSQWWNFVKSTDAYVTSDAKIAEVTGEIERLRTKLNQSCGSPVISDFIHQECVRRSPLLLDFIRNFLYDNWQDEGNSKQEGFWLSTAKMFGAPILETALVRRATLLEECLEVNLLFILNNLADRIKGDAEGPIPPNKLINGLMMLGSDVGGQEFAVLKKCEEIDQMPGLSDSEKEKAKSAIYNQIAEHLLQVGLPNGSRDLILPLPPGTPLVKSKIIDKIKEALVDSLRQLDGTLKSVNQEHVELLAELKKVSSDGEAVARKLAGIARATVQGILEEKGEVIESSDRKKEDWLEKNLELKSNPLLRGVLSQFLKDCGSAPEMKLLFQKADTFIYPLTVHILGSMAKDVSRDATRDASGEIKKPVLSLFYTDVLKDLREFVEQHPRVELEKAIESYQKQVEEIECITAENIKEIEKEYGDVSAPQMAARKVTRDNFSHEFQQKKEKVLEQIKSPFDPLVNKLILKMGVDEKGLTPILPYFQKLTADWFKNHLNKICLNTYQEVVAREAQPPIAVARITGYEEGRQLIQDMVNRLPKDLLPKKADEADQWYRKPLSDLLTSPDLSALQPYAVPWIVDTVSDLFVHLADSNPLTAGKDKVDMLNGAMQHIALIAVKQWKDANFVAKVDALCKMTEGPEKEKEKKKVFGPIAEEIMQKGFKDGFRLPLKDMVAEIMQATLLPKLLYNGAEKWLAVQATIAQNGKSLQRSTSDGDAVAKAIKVVADQTGAALSDQAKKVGEGIEAKPTEAGIELESALKSLNDPVLRGALIQLLKGAQDVEPVREFIKKADAVSYPLFMHMLARLTENAEGRPTTAAAVTNNLLESIFNFAAGHREELAQAFLKEDKNAFKAQFTRLVDEILAKAGLDPEGLAKIVPFGSNPLSELIKSQALDFCVDFYEEVAAKEGQAPDRYKNLPGYAEARHFLKEALQDAGADKGLMSTIKETLAKGKNRRIIQNSLADVINELLYAGKLPFEKNWIRKAVKELVDPSAPHLKELESFAQPYIIDSVTDLFAHLALSYHQPVGEAKGDMVQNAIAHLVAIMKAEIKDPELVKKLTEWKALPEVTEENKRVKAKQKEKLRKELFGECSSKILDKVDMRAPKALRPFLKKLMIETVLPDQLFKIASDMLVMPVDERPFRNLGGRDEFNLIVDGMAEKFTPVILQKTKEYADLIAAKANEKLTHNHLTIREEAWLGKDVDSLLIESKSDLKPARSFVEFYLAGVLRRGLSNLALKHSEEGEFAGNIALYLRNRLGTLTLKPTVREMIRIYSEQTAPLRLLDQQIAELRKQAIREHPQVSEKTAADLARLKAERLQMEQEIDKKDGIKATYQELLKAFAPEVKKLLADMGFSNAESLPVPYFLKDILWKNLTGTILPDLCLTSMEKLIGTFDIVIPRRKELEQEIKKYEDLLTQFHVETQRKSDKDYRLPPGVKVSPLVSNMEKILPNFVEKFVESQVALKGREKALDLVDDTLIPMMYSGKKGQVAALKVEANRKEIARWMDKESPAMVTLLKERLSQALKDVMKATMLKSTYHFLHNLETLEKNNPENLFEFMFQAVPLATEHVSTTTAIAKKQNSLLKSVHIYQVDSLTILREFEKAGKLHPAMPGVKEFQALRNEEEHIRQLEKVIEQGLSKGSKWHENVEMLKGKEGPENGPEYYLVAAKIRRDEFLKVIDARLKNHFSNDFSKYFLRMGGIRGAQDLPGGETFMKMIWEMTGKAEDVEKEYTRLIEELKKNGQSIDEGQIRKKAEEKAWEKFVEHRFFQPAASGMMELIQAVFAPEQVNSYLATICTALNEKLEAYKISGATHQGDFEKSPAADAKMDKMQERCQIFWKQVIHMLPASVVAELQELPLIEKIPGKTMAGWTRSILLEFPLSKMVEVGITQALPNLPEKLPMSMEEAKEAKELSEKKDADNIKKIREQAAQTVPILLKMIERNIVAKWESMHAKIDAWLEKTFGQRFVEVKSFFDNIFHAVFITLIMGPIYKKLVRKVITKVLVLWGKIVARDFEVARRNIVMQDPDKKKDPEHKEERKININANLLLKMVDEFKKFYPAPA
ncbi:MAG: hypothetical protein LLG04_15385 [Parachlamydia sp.]|nr:hypothetical protein [Parachlamydia sp.]